MAHEIGHMLMGPTHFPIGMMKPIWDREDTKKASRGLLQFTPAQMDAIRGIVAQRANVQGSRAEGKTPRNREGIGDHGVAQTPTPGSPPRSPFTIEVSNSCS